MKEVDEKPPIVGPLAEQAERSAGVRIYRDPYEALDDLMVVVEALCPEWPPRRAFAASARFIL